MAKKKLKFNVTLCRTITFNQTVQVPAGSDEEADEMVQELINKGHAGTCNIEVQDAEGVFTDIEIENYEEQFEFEETSESSSDE